MAIRFYDKEIITIQEDGLDRDRLLSFFLQGNIDEAVCVFDREQKFCGLITYKSLILSENIDRAILREKVLLEKNLWEKASELFKYNKDLTCVPLVNKQGELESFCFNDDRLNKILRQIRALLDLEEFLDFHKLFPSIQCVKLYGLNEVSYELYRLFIRLGLKVQVYGNKWGDILEQSQEPEEYPESAVMHIYAEGCFTVQNSEYMEQDISGHFEIVEQYFRANKEVGLLRTREPEWNEIAGYLKKENKNIIIVGNNENAEEAYAFLLQHDLKPVCICCNYYDYRGKYLAGLPVYSYHLCKEMFSNAVYLLANTDIDQCKENFMERLHYEGYRYNKDTYKLPSYGGKIRIKEISRIMQQKKVVLVGAELSCIRLYKVLADTASEMRMRSADIIYCNYYEKESSLMPAEVKVCSIEECVQCYSDALYYLLPYQIACLDEKKYLSEFIKQMYEAGIKDVSTYFFKHRYYMLSEEKLVDKCHACIEDNRLHIDDVNQIVIGATEGYSGNVFIMQILDYHPNIIAIGGFTILQSSILEYVQEIMCAEKKEELGFLLLKRLRDELNLLGNGTIKDIFENKEKFLYEFNKTIMEKSELSSKDIFIALHIAYFYMQGRVYSSGTPMTIYWEQHNNKTGHNYELYVGWAKQNFKKVTILKLVRNPIQRSASILRALLRQEKAYFLLAGSLGRLECPSFQKCKEDMCVIRFEDLKLHPQKVLPYLCERLEIPWSDILMQTTCNGKRASFHNGNYEVEDFDLRPVFRENAEYFDAFDVLRLQIVNAPFNKAYGYPYIDKNMFSKAQIAEWMQKPFRFEEKISFGGEQNRKEFRQEVKKQIGRFLDIQEYTEENKESLVFYEYYKI